MKHGALIQPPLRKRKQWNEQKPFVTSLPAASPKSKCTRTFDTQAIKNDSHTSRSYLKRSRWTGL